MDSTPCSGYKCTLNTVIQTIYLPLTQINMTITLIPLSCSHAAEALLCNKHMIDTKWVQATRGAFYTHTIYYTMHVVSLSRCRQHTDMNAQAQLTNKRRRTKTWPPWGKIQKYRNTTLLGYNILYMMFSSCEKRRLEYSTDTNFSQASIWQGCVFGWHSFRNSQIHVLQQLNRF